MIQNLQPERRVCHTRMRQALISGCFEVGDEPVISGVIHWREKEKEAERDTQSSEETESKSKQMENFEMTSVNIIRTLICTDDTDA